MERRNLLAGLIVLAMSLFLLAGTAFAHGTTTTKSKKGKKTDPAAGCEVLSLPEFTDQSEGRLASSVADIIEVECEKGYEEEEVTISSQELFARCHELSWARINQTTGEWEVIPTNKEKVVTRLDDDDNATVVVWGGPSCATGSSLISAHLNTSPAETFTTNFTVLQPKGSKEGITALTPPPGEGKKVEDATFSDAATILQIEAPTRYAEKEVVVNAEELYFDCPLGPTHLKAVGPKEEEIANEEGVIRLKKETPFTLNNNGNAFVVLLAGQSCTPATLGIEASINAAPGFLTYETPFTILEPQPTF
jgi:hypothetical protein